MGKKLKVCTAIRNKDVEDSIKEIIQSQGWKHSNVNTGDILGDNRKDTLVFIIEDSYSSILNFIEKHNSSELNFLPTIILSAEDSHHSDWVRYVKYSEKYFHTGAKHFKEILVQVVKTMNAFRNSSDFKRLHKFREAIANSFKEKDDFKGFMNAVLPDMLDLLHADRGSVMLLNNDGHLVIEASSKKELVGLEVAYKKESVAWTVMDTKKPVFVEDVENDSRFQKMQGYNKDYFLSIPIFLDKDEIIGVLNLSDKTISLLFDQIDHENANMLLDILEPYFFIEKKLK